MNIHSLNFKKIFKNTAPQTNRYDVFRDFIFMASIAIENVFLKSEEKESDYMRIVNKYKPDDIERFTQMYAELILALDSEPSDILGSLFMELEIGSASLGQFFTPYPVCKMLSELSIGADFDEKLSKTGYISVSEPASGSGSMLIAFSQSMLDKGYNPQRQMTFQAIDLDPIAARMAYIQLSLLGLVGEVVIGNTLTLDFHETLKTPAFYLWGHTLKRSSVFNFLEEISSKADFLEGDINAENEPFCLNLDLFSNCQIAKSLSNKLAVF
ncbi:N-6 DNA methylase [Pseudoalteromonas distincta]|uniref:N-6 DNA methylase n=1 Tax=Pseudoalteromonas distincta TaxID=77608 RepID=UPI001192D29F|nr:N-6 DNA methylase [Pseudoalteromonas elyakovii]TVU70353.1 N-6 DNA methylase [Pseudoalteromonas elyakovii]